MKICTGKCARELPLENFTKRADSKDGLQARCSDCLSEKRRKWYVANHDVEYARVKAVAKRVREWFLSYKETLACIRCGEDHPACLDFHHRDPNQKEIEVSRGPGLGWSKERILNEIAKCDVLCANCHRKYHYALVVQLDRTLGYEPRDL